MKIVIKDKEYILFPQVKNGKTIIKGITKNNKIVELEEDIKNIFERRIKLCWRIKN